MEIDCRLDELATEWLSRLDELATEWLREQAAWEAQRAEGRILGAVKLLHSYGCRSQWDWKQLTDKVLELEGKL